jgi:hypothetical protein
MAFANHSYTMGERLMRTVVTPELGLPADEEARETAMYAARAASCKPMMPWGSLLVFINGETPQPTPGDLLLLVGPPENVVVMPDGKPGVPVWWRARAGVAPSVARRLPTGATSIFMPTPGEKDVHSKHLESARAFFEPAELARLDAKPPLPGLGADSGFRFSVLVPNTVKRLAEGPGRDREDRVCGGCAAKGNAKKACGRCGLTYYCGAECQKKAWKEHKARAQRRAVAAPCSLTRCTSPSARRRISGPTRRSAST